MLGQASRVLPSHSFEQVETFRAPPRSGAFPLYRLNQVSAVRSRPSFDRSEITRWQCGFSPPPRWIASV